MQIIKLSILVLNETRVKKINQVKVLKSFTKWKCLENYYHAENGRFWVLWDERVLHVDEILQGNQFIHIRVTILGIDDSFLLTAIYAFNYKNQRSELWSAITTLAQTIDEPWILMGNFNKFLKHFEKVRDGVEIGGHTNELLELFTATGLGDLQFSGVLLTWC